MINLGEIEKLPLKPELLSHPNIPKPLHGTNPRTIMGRAAWDKYRQNALIKAKHSCRACGRTGCRLELHEDYSIDFKKAKMQVHSMEPLCTDCHSFIHSGFLIFNLHFFLFNLRHNFNFSSIISSCPKLFAFFFLSFYSLLVTYYLLLNPTPNHLVTGLAVAFLLSITKSPPSKVLNVFFIIFSK